MAAEIRSDQRIARLAPLAEVLAHIESHVKPVRAQRCEISAAHGMTLADDIVVAEPLPAHAVALRDGFAVDAEATRDASSYAPAILPAPAFINAGEPLPAGTNAILPQETVIIRGATAETSVPATTGDGILPKGADARPPAFLQSGYPLRNGSIAALQAAGVSTVSVRAPRVSVIGYKRSSDRILDAALYWTQQAIVAAGGVVSFQPDTDLETASRDDAIDAVISIGGTGTGKHDNAVTTLARIGDVAFHGIAIAPGETAAFGSAAEKPVLLVPGRLDAAFACWLLLAENIMTRLSERQTDGMARTAHLTRKVSSSLGMTELVLLSCAGEDAEPLASTYLPLQTLARANGWFSVPAQSEGCPAGTAITVRPLP